MAKCKSCGAPLLKNAQFCTECGTEVIIEPQESYCPECGEVVQAEDTFCGHCGHQLSEETQTIQQENISAATPKKSSPQKRRAKNIARKKKSPSKKGWPLWAKAAAWIIGLIIIGNLIPWDLLDTEDNWTYSEEPKIYQEESSIEENPEFIAAREEYLEAYARYTDIATGHAEGDMEAALQDYKEKYARFKGMDANDGEKPSIESDQPVPSTISKDQKPSEKLTLSDGAHIQIPGRSSVFNDSLSWKSRSLTQDERSRGFTGQVYVFESFDLFKMKGKSTIQIPINDQSESIWFKGAMDIWIPLVYQSTGEANSFAQFTMDEEPTPWEFAISSKPYIKEDLSEAHQDLFNFERMMAQDRKGIKPYIAEIESGAVGKPSTMSLFNTSFIWDPQTEWTERLIYLWKLFRIVDIEGTTAESWRRYKKAIGELSFLRKLPKNKRDEYDLRPYLFRFEHEKDGKVIIEDTSLPGYWSCRNTTEWVEYWASKYAPWGIHLTEELVKLFDENGNQQYQFLSCLEPVGGANDWVDLMLTFEDVPRSIRDKFYYAHEGDFDPASSERRTILRVYAPRALEMGYFHTIFYRGDQFLRYFPVLYGLGFLTGVIATPAVAPAAYLLLVNMSWAMLEWTTEDYVQNQTNNTEIHECINYSHTGYQKVYKDFFITMGKKSGIQLNNKILRNTLSDRKWDNRELLASLICAIALDALGHGEMQRLIQINNSRKSYYNNYLPPIVLQTVYTGRSKPKEGIYGSDKLYKGVYHLDMERLYPSDWSSNFNSDHEIKSGFSSDIIFSKDSKLWKEYSVDKLTHNHKPQRQFLRVNISKELIDYRKARYNSVELEEQSWEKIPLDKLGLIIRLRQNDGQVKYAPLNDVTQPTDRVKNYRSSIVPINLGFLEVGAWPKYPTGFLGENMFYDAARGPSYKVEKSFGSALYSIDIGYKDAQGAYNPISQTLSVDFSLANEKINKFDSKDIIYQKLEFNKPETFIATHHSLFGEPLPTYRWHLANTSPLVPKDKRVIITGHTWKGSGKIDGGVVADPGKGVLYTFKGITKEVVSKGDGSFTFDVPCDALEIIVEGQGEKQTINLDDCDKVYQVELSNARSNIIQVSTIDPDDIPDPPDDPELNKLIEEQLKIGEPKEEEHKKQKK